MMARALRISPRSYYDYKKGIYGRREAKHDDLERRIQCKRSVKFTDKLYDLIAFRYPDALKALHQLYKKSKPNFPLFKYKVVSRFLRCNLGGYDNKLDLESDGTINLESVPCPLRKECDHENIICRPQPSNPFSPREFEVMQHFCKGESVKDIAASLYIAENTCKSHKQSAMRKVSCSSLPEFMHYAEANSLFG